MDNIIFEDPSKRVSHKNKVGSNVALPVARCGMAIEQAPVPIDPYFSHGTNFDVHIHGKEPVSLYDMFSLSGDEELGNEDLINGSSQVLSQGNINGQQEWSVSVSREPAKDFIPIDPAILEKESMSEANVVENVALDSGSLHPPSPKSVALHGHAQIVENPAPAAEANSDTQRIPSKRRLSDKTDLESPCKRCRSDSLTAEGHPRTLYSSFSAAPLHERLDFLAWIFKQQRAMDYRNDYHESMKSGTLYRLEYMDRGGNSYLGIYVPYRMFDAGAPGDDWTRKIL